MTAQAFQQRERRRRRMEILQVVAFSALMAGAFFLFVVTLFQIEMILGGGL